MLNDYSLNGYITVIIATTVLTKTRRSIRACLKAKPLSAVYIKYTIFTRG